MTTSVHPPEQPVASTSYIPPTKYVLSKAHLGAFQRSKTHQEIFDFIEDLNEAVVGKKLTEAGEGSERTKPILGILDSVLEIAKATPPVDNKLSRFGNPAFKDFYDKIGEASSELHSRINGLPSVAIPEIEVYFKESWGNKQRVDYGSGMEFNFLCWLLCLTKLGVLTKDDYEFLVLGVFWRYIEVMRYLQSTYWLEPAGSHGVWGLDDYHFLPFLWGAGQLKDHKHLRPKAIHDPEILDAFNKDYMYLSCISFINSIKTASLRWHSPMLDDISAVKTWAKVNEGMKKMYKAEVLGKLPVMQHALFGSILPFPTPEEDSELQKALEEEGAGEVGQVDEHGHIHVKGEPGWTMDCCGIPVPSAFAAAQDGATPHGGTAPFTARSGIKPIPFD
ncbi:serine/threonine-protein phosphatase 2A activator 2 [Kwoniella dejecticola CBS 10117]|uniref:Serine/threonine-protein phosphatase 2A activator n=1 Tax=Kwoniella dejecticola CBS 10117 TaxID=1296121 RepID=A0A1A6A8W3_9TREE|nr:serine/threonine-protein phosphatase 2A activator 2 [Kwoniella dejecticola CBS 10117]OBR86492.1 serine/threonine-protein phosphatase 2A activator 2 [Kwoniella dejecticola CBS 10117]